MTTEARGATVNIKEAPSQATMLSLPKSDTRLELIIDASNHSVGTGLIQWVDESWQPLSVFSTELKLNETRYSASSRKLIATYIAIRHFRHLLDTQEFTLYMDHKPLVYALKASSDTNITAQLNFTINFQHQIR